MTDSAWDEANAVMPGAWRVRDVTDLMIGPPNDFVAVAVLIGPLPVKPGVLNAYGDSPDDALHHLTERLREKRDGPR